jgi:hypothetical protein
MLAAIIANNQNVPAQPRLPVVHIDRGGGGPSWPRYEIVDIAAAIAAFPEISGEHPVARAARRHRWIGEVLPGIREAREKREAVAFLAGATLADRAADERHAMMDQLKIEQLVEIIDAVRGEARSAALPEVSRAITAPDRGASNGNGMSGGLGIGLFVGGLLVGLALAKRSRARARAL